MTQHQVFLQDYKEYLIDTNLYCTKELMLYQSALDIEHALEPVRFVNFPSIKLVSKPKDSPEQKELLDKIKALNSALDLLHREYKRCTYYESYDFSSIEISDELAGDFFAYMLRKRQQDITLH